MPHLLSILVVSFNERRHLDRLKASFDALRRPDGVSIETVLIDGGSRDGTAARARETGWTRVIELPGANIPVCRNAGLRESRGDWVAFIDADCELDPGWLEHAAPLLSGPDPIVMGWPVRPPHPGTWLQRAWHAHWLTKNFAPEDHQGVRVVRREAFRLLTTRNMVMTRSLADAVNGFDENLPTGEDTDFVFRAFQRGHLVLGLPSLDVVHHGEPATLRQFYRQQLWHANRSSYKKIMAETGGKSGGNAPRFAALFLVGLGIALAGVLAAAVKMCPCYLLALLPLAALVFLPALRTALRAKKPLLVFPLGVIYFTYGLARALDLAGFYRNKPSWKAKHGLRQAEALQTSPADVLFRTRGLAWQVFFRRFLVWLVLAASGAISVPVYPTAPGCGWLATGLLAAASFWALAATVSLWRVGKRLQAVLLLVAGYLSAKFTLLVYASSIYGER